MLSARVKEKRTLKVLFATTICGGAKGEPKGPFHGREMRGRDCQ
jgi:hypothetical protein